MLSTLIHDYSSIPKSVSIEHIKTVIAEEMREVDQLIRQKLSSDVVLIRQVAEYILNNGGKRLRPALALLSANLFGYRGKQHLDLAAIIEFIHTATLLHDDVVDQSDMRRGNQTANAVFGNAASVLVGDFLYSRAFQMMVSLDNMQVMAVLADASNVIAEGEVLQLLNCRNADLDETAYLQVIRYKTAKLFEAAARVGAILGEASLQAEQAMATYGAHLGCAFQIIDDVLDYSGEHSEIGKNLGDDLAEGKTTLPLIYAMQQGNPTQHRLIRAAIEQGNLTDFEPIVDIIKKTGALDYAKRQADQEISQAKTALGDLPDSIYKNTLLELADFAIARRS